MENKSELFNKVAKASFRNELQKIATCGSYHKKYNKKKGSAMAKYSALNDSGPVIKNNILYDNTTYNAF